MGTQRTEARSPRATKSVPSGASREADERALLLVDFINPLDFPCEAGFIARAERAARRTARLKRRLKAAQVPVIYANDHFGGWTRDFSTLVRDCAESGVPGHPLARILAPEPDDYPVLKPRNSAFYGTPLEFLLDELGVRELVIAGIAADNCVLFSASDAYLRRYKLWVPRDCVASVDDADRLNSLAHMNRVLKASIRTSRVRSDPAQRRAAKTRSAVLPGTGVALGGDPEHRVSEPTTSLQ